jgi:hypothetical protein
MSAGRRLAAVCVLTLTAPFALTASAASEALSGTVSPASGLPMRACPVTRQAAVGLTWSQVADAQIIHDVSLSIDLSQQASSPTSGAAPDPPGTTAPVW